MTEGTSDGKRWRYDSAVPDDLELPYVPRPAVPEPTRRAIEAIALRANDRYLTEVIERFAFCPYSREGRQNGETRRVVYRPDSTSVDALVEEMERAIDSGAAVTQVIFPGVVVDADAFSRFAIALTDIGHRRHGDEVFAVAPLHPDLEFGDEGHAMVPLFRRAPDATIQWVRLDSLAAIYEGREGNDTYLPPEEIFEFLAAHPKGKPRLYDRICDTNAAMAHRLGVPEVVSMLRAITDEARASYDALSRPGPS